MEAQELLQEIFDYLKDNDTGTEKYENVTYNLSSNNSFRATNPQGWLIQSSPLDPDSQCQLLAEIQNQLTSKVINEPAGRHYIDILHLANNSTYDSFQQGLIDTICQIAQTAVGSVVIRYLEGNQAKDANMDFLQQLQQRSFITQSKVTFYAATINYPWVDGVLTKILKDMGSWNHAKIFAIDGVISFVGGQNYWSDYITSPSTPYDVSIQVSGSATTAAHLFANYLWNYVASPIDGSTFHETWVLGPQNSTTQDLPLQFVPGNYPVPHQPEQIPILAVGNLGLWGGAEQVYAGLDLLAQSTDLYPENTYNELVNAKNRGVLFPFNSWAASYSIAMQASIAARSIMIRNVQQGGYIRISQQKFANTDIEPSSGYVLWPMQLLNDIVEAIKSKGATVNILVSNHIVGDSLKDGYSDDMGAAALTGIIQGMLTQHVSKKRAALLVSQLLTVKEMTAGTFNHGKVCIIDDQVFYVGSDNVYPAYLQEFGYVVGDRNTTMQFIKRYWSPLWNKAVLPPPPKKAKPSKAKKKSKPLYT